MELDDEIVSKRKLPDIAKVAIFKLIKHPRMESKDYLEPSYQSNNPS